MATWKMELDFQTGQGWEDITHYVVLENDNLVHRIRQLHNNLKPTVNTCTFKLTESVYFFNKIINSFKDIKCRIYRNNKPYFTGYVRNDTISGKITHLLEPVQIEIVDRSIKLKEKITASIYYESLKVCDPADKNNSIIHRLFSLAGYEVGFSHSGYQEGDDIDFPVINSAATGLAAVIDTFVVTEDQKIVYEKVLSDILLEFKYVYNNDPDGISRLYYLSTDIIPGEIKRIKSGINDEMLDSFQPERKKKQNDSVSVLWWKHELKEDVVVFSDTTNGNNILSCNIEIEAGNHYPENDFNDPEVKFYAEYRCDEGEIIVVKNPQLDIIKVGDVQTYRFHNHHTKADVMFISEVGGALQKFNIKGDAIIKTTRNKTNTYSESTSKNEYEFEGLYINTAEDARALSNFLLNYHIRNCTFKFKTTISVMLGEYIDIEENSVLGIENKTRIIKIEDWGNDEYILTLIGITEFITYNVQNSLYNQSLLPAIKDQIVITNQNIDNIINQLQFIPTAFELLNGMQKGGWTETPEKPVFRCTPLGSSVIIEIIKQYNLSKLLHYAIRISKDQLNWYSLYLGGTGADWKGESGEYTPWELELFVHSKLPLAGTAEDPQPETYYYQIAQVTQKLAISPWSETAAVIVSPIQNGDIAANFLIANKVITGNLVTLLLQAAYAIIGYRGTGTYDSPAEGDRQTVIEGDEIRVGEEYTGGNWSMIKGIRLGGALMGIFLGMIGCKGIYHPENPPDNVEFFPNNNYRVFNFEGNYADQNGIDDWTVKSDVALSSIDKKFGTYSLYDDGSIPMTFTQLRTANNYVCGESQSLGFWIKVTIMTLPNHASYGIAWDQDNNLLIYVNKIDATHIRFCASIAKGGSQTFIVNTSIIAINTWNYVALSYNSSTNTLYLTVNNERYSVIPGGNFTSITVSHTFINQAWYDNDYDFRSFIDEVCIAPNQFINPDIWIQHYNHNLPWNTEYSAADIILRCAPNGRIRFVTQQSTTDVGLPHFDDLTDIDFNDKLLTTDIQIVNLSAFIPLGTVAVRLLVYFNRVSGNFYGKVSPDLTTGIDDQFFAYSDGYRSDHIETRVKPDRTFQIAAGQGTATVYLKLLKKYI